MSPPVSKPPPPITAFYQTGYDVIQHSAVHVITSDCQVYLTTYGTQVTWGYWRHTGQAIPGYISNNGNKNINNNTSSNRIPLLSILYIYVYSYLFIYCHLYSAFSIVQCSNALYRLWDGEIQGHTGQPSVWEIDAHTMYNQWGTAPGRSLNYPKSITTPCVCGDGLRSPTHHVADNGLGKR